MNGQPLTFDVECVWRRNMIMRDNETGSLWQHATGEAIAGPLRGAQLTLLGGELISWGGWKQAQPQTAAALEPEQWTGLIAKDRVTAVLEKVTSLATVPGKTRPDGRLPSHEEVVGIVVDGAARAYRLADLRHPEGVLDMVNGRQIQVVYDQAQDVVHAFADDTPLFSQRTWWMGWYEFHPQTTIYQAVKSDP